MDFSERQQEPGKKFIGIGLVVLFHVLLVWALINGLATKIVHTIKNEVETKIIDEIKPPPPPPVDLPPPPPPKTLSAPPPPFIPPPEVQVQQQAPRDAIATTTNVKPTSNELPKTVAQPAEGGEARAPVIVPAQVKFGSTNCPPPDYPRSSLRNEESGVTVLNVTFGPDGVVSNAVVEKSSGFRTLDSAVKNYLMSGQCKADKVGTVDGKPQSTTARVQYVWSLP